MHVALRFAADSCRDRRTHSWSTLCRPEQIISPIGRYQECDDITYLLYLYIFLFFHLFPQSSDARRATARASGSSSAPGALRDAERVRFWNTTPTSTLRKAFWILAPSLLDVSSMQVLPSLDTRHPIPVAFPRRAWAGGTGHDHHRPTNHTGATTRSRHCRPRPSTAGPASGTGEPQGSGP